MAREPKKSATKTETPQQPLPKTAEVAKDKQVTTSTKPERSLAEQVKARGVSEAAWHTLTGSVFPGAKHASVLLAVDYCRARGLDVLKRPCHIVPMDVKNAATGKHEKRDVILPGIYELRTTAHRTGQYLGHTRIEYHGEIEIGTQDNPKRVPRSASFTVRRWTPNGVAEFPTEVFFEEVAGWHWDYDSKSRKLNAKWFDSPRQMLDKCLEAAGLRKAFPEEIGGQYVPEEVETEALPALPAPSALPVTNGGGVGPGPTAQPAVQVGGDAADDMNAALGLTDDGDDDPTDPTPPEDDQKPM